MSGGCYGFESRTARTAHMCDYCRTTIDAGDVYQRWVFIYDREASAVEVHTGCNAVARAHWDEYGVEDESRLVGMDPIDEWVQDVGGIDAEQAAGALVRAMIDLRVKRPLITDAEIVRFVSCMVVRRFTEEDDDGKTDESARAIVVAAVRAAEVRS